jgi:hypothetical protein
MRLDPEQARLIRDRERGLQRPHAFAPQSGTRKHRDIRFAKLPPNQVEHAGAFLAQLDKCEVAPGFSDLSLSVWYEVTDYTLEGIESALRQQGFHLDNTLYAKLLRALVHYCEQTQLRNMHGPQRLIKKSHEVYSQAWDHHPHGDHDDTPPELRQDR